MSDFTRSLVININNASGSDLTLNWGSLTGGGWQQAPVPGTPINSGGLVNYENGVPNALTSLGGDILLTPANGGSIDVKWNWPAGSPVSGGVTATGTTGIGTMYQFDNTATNHPSMQVYIINDNNFASLAKTLKAQK